MVLAMRELPRTSIESGVTHCVFGSSCAAAVAVATAEAARANRQVSRRMGIIYTACGRPVPGDQPAALFVVGSDLGGAQNPEVELRPIGGDIDLDLIALRELRDQDLLRE